ncbi:MAG: L-aspartate oxidase [Acidobacteriota bacterium]
MRCGEISGPVSGDAVIVVGCGVAGLRAAIEVAKAGIRVAVLAKDSARESNTQQAQGGVAVALSDEDRVGLHYRDTLDAGDGLCEEEAVRVLVAEGPRRIEELIEWGARFDREGSRLAFTREGAHSARRVLHAHGDSTGREILRALTIRASELERISFSPHVYSVDAVVENGAVRGLIVLDEATGRSRFLGANAIILATGGAGRIYRETTNPPQATGDGIALAWRAGATLCDMEFMQFHPTALHVEGAPRFLLSEALRGEGGVLVAPDGERFMSDVDPRAELAPRDVVARAIVDQIRRCGTQHVGLDMTRIDPSYLKKRFPRIYTTCLRYGVDLTRGPVPVAPAAHYLMGGVATDLWGRTSVPGLYAAGEVASTGVHGANRLASNSLLEGLVFGARAGRAIVEDRMGRASGERPRRHVDADARRVGAAESTERIRETAWETLGIVRSRRTLVRGREIFDDILRGGSRGVSAGRPSRADLEAVNMATLAALMARSALAREESRGSHYRDDFPRRDDAAFGGSSVIEHGSDRVTFSDGQRSPRRVAEEETPTSRRGRRIPSSR